MKTKVATVFTLALLAFARVNAQTSYSITDLGTLGGSSSSAAGMAGQQGHNAAGMIVGTSTAADNTAHAFLYSNGQMRDLNELCDLSTSDFNVLTTASSIDDAGQIIGAGITAKGQTHAFLLKPTPVDGGNWSYSCCQWIWKQGSTDSGTNNNSGWWWESSCHCYNWHGPPGKHPPCPSNPPHCWYWPLPCSTDMGCSPYPHTPTPTPTVTPTPKVTPTPTVTVTPTPNKPAFCWCCVDGKVSNIADILCRARKGQCYASEAEARSKCSPPPIDLCWCCNKGNVSHIPRIQCLVRGGQCYPDEPSAFTACGHVGVFCCHDGSSSLEMIDCTDCVKSGGRCFATQAEALKDCAKPPAKFSWCCPNPTTGGTPVFISIDDCQKVGGTCFDTKEEAIARCSVIAYSYCCVDGQVTGPMLRSACSGQAFNTAAEAQKYCSAQSAPPGEYCWCCFGTQNGGPTNYTKTALCQANGGTPFSSQEEAIARCEVIPYCYCCDVGSLDQSPAGPMSRAQCLALNCPTCLNHYTPFDTLEDAEKYCSGQALMDQKITPPPRAFQTPPIPHRPRIPNNPNGQLQPSSTPEVTPFRRRQPQSTPTPTPNPRRKPSDPVPQATPISTPNPTPIFHRPHATPTPPRQRPLHRFLNKPKPTPTPPFVR